ncbi:Mitochondrial adenine nucleotide transporter ADNT1 [Camellia lanceoleosa]|uniref:Mitochondrial adenine nucleotide transporter ADNT1 n=1 Tax=Camellia lanceoleosa TaxID=1840588 RepID=A0ACC0HDV5_9ERIC|nr:Mitochondrial adenine nucleotide transporter ADNT1 [Camellia lanceoleosa]
MQVQNPHSIKYNGTVQSLKYIWRTEGLQGLFKGNGTNCARIVPNSAVKFFSYEEASKYATVLPFLLLLMFCLFLLLVLFRA